jgi:hypothetical protein
LIHIAKDAHAAAEAMKSHNTTAENKYRDQANDSATVRHFRKTNGMPTWYKKKYGHSTNEEVEQVDELKKSTLASYAKKATDDVSYHSFTAGTMSAKDPERLAQDKKAMKRQSGVIKAVDRLAKEEVQAVDEAVSKKKRVMSFMSHDPEAGQRILAMGKKEREEKKAFKSGQSEINRLKRMGEEVEMFEAVDPVEARDILKNHGGADEDFHALPSEHKNSLHHLAYKFKHNPGKGASGSRARMFHAHLKRQAAKADKAQADVQKLTKEEHDYEYEMARNQLTTASRSIERLMGMLKGEGNLEAWVQSKLTMAADYLDTVADYMESDKKN